LEQFIHFSINIMNPRINDTESLKNHYNLNG